MYSTVALFYIHCTIGCVVQVQLQFNEHHVCVHRPTFMAWLILAPASNSVFTTSRCPQKHAAYNGLQPFCNTNVIITRGWTSGGGCWNITYDRCNISVQRETCQRWRVKWQMGGREGTEPGEGNRASRVLWSMRYCTSNLQFSLWHLIPSLGTDFFSMNWTHGTRTTGGNFLQINFSSNTFCCIISNLIATSFSI